MPTRTTPSSTSWTGFSKRPGTRFIASLSDFASGADLRIHTIKRDDHERYLVVYGKGVLRVFDLNGREQEIEITAAAQAYLSRDGTAAAAGAQADDVVMVTNADYTLIGNRRVALKTKASERFTVTAEHADYEAMIATTPATDTYHRTKAPSNGRPAGYYQYLGLGSATYAKFYGRTVGGDWAKAPTYRTDGRNPGRFAIRFLQPVNLTGLTWTASTMRLSKVGAFAGYTWKSGDKILITGAASLPHVFIGEKVITAKISDDEIELASSVYPSDRTGIKAGVITHYHNVLTDFFAETWTTANPMSDVAAAFQAALVTAGATGALVAWEATSSTTGRFVITSPYYGAGSTIYGPENVAGQTEFPWAEKDPLRPGGTSQVVQGTGDPSLDQLDVFDRWLRVPAPGQLDAFPDETTMPLKMVRLSPAFTNEETNLYNPAEFHVDVIQWKGRLTGDVLTNPAPSIFPQQVGQVRYLADLTFFSNRLVLAADESIVMSQAGDFFNLYLDDAENIIDSDPIDVAMSSNEVTIADYLVPFRKTLQVFTRSGRQFELTAGGGDALTPTSASIVPTTHYQTMPAVRPATMGDKTYFVSARKDSAQVYESYYSDQDLATIASDVTAHAFDYLPIDLKSIKTSPNNSTVIVLPKDENQFYVYRAFWPGPQKAQSAWGRYVFGQSDRIADIGIIEDDAYLLTEAPAGYLLQRLSIPPEVPDVRRGTWYSDLIADMKLSDWTSIIDGSFRITIDGVAQDVSGCNFTTQTDLAGVALRLQDRIRAVFPGTDPAFRPNVRVQGNRFVITSGSDGIDSTVGPVERHSASTGTNLATTALLGAPGRSYGATMPAVVHFDNQITVTGTYDEASNETTWDYALSDSEMDGVVLGRDFGPLAGSRLIVHRANDHSVAIVGDYSQGYAYCGRPYTMGVKLSRPYARDGRDQAVLDGRLQIRKAIISHRDTGYYKVRVEQPSRESREYPLRLIRASVSTIGELPIDDEGTLEALVQGNSDNTVVSVINDSPYPSIISAVEWVGDLTRRSV